MYYEFREARQHEMGACFELRNSCYRTTVSDAFVESEQFGEHDDLARHFGLFCRDASEQRLIGYVRVSEAVPSTPSLPFLHYFGPQGVPRAKRMLGRLLGRYAMAVEAGRLSVSRSAGRMLLAKHVVDCLTAIYGVGFGIPAVLACAQHHRSLYESVGFRQVLADAEIAVPWKRHLASICMVRLPQATTSARPRLLRMLDAYQHHGVVAYHPWRHDDFTPTFEDPEAMASWTRLALIAAA